MGTSWCRWLEHVERPLRVAGGGCSVKAVTVCKVRHPRRSNVVGGCICGEGQLFPVRLRHGSLAMSPEPPTLQRSQSALCGRCSRTQRRSASRPYFGKSLVLRLHKSCPLWAESGHLVCGARLCQFKIRVPQRRMSTSSPERTDP